MGIKPPAFFKASNDSGVSFTYIPDCCAICVILFAASVPKCNQRLNLSRGILRAHSESPYCAENSWIAIFVAENQRTILIRNDLISALIFCYLCTFPIEPLLTIVNPLSRECRILAILYPIRAVSFTHAVYFGFSHQG